MSDKPNVLCENPTFSKAFFLRSLVSAIFILCLTGHNNTTYSQGIISPGAFRIPQYLPLLHGKNVAVVCNYASAINSTHLVDTLLHYSRNEKKSFAIKMVFSPEHGFSGTYDAGSKVDGILMLYDSIPVISLYGTKTKPAKSDLQDIDIVVFDLQDVGVRFYTYLSTLHNVMQACAEEDIELVVLDRPNPHIHYVDGPVLETKYSSFVGMHPVPVVYGMTIGEYAHMINGEGWLGGDLHCTLKVIEVENYSRHSRYSFPEKPSPNLPNMRSVLLYPSLCFFEGTIISVGRGTPFPFQVFGHPDYPEKDFSFVPVSMPGASVNPEFKNKKCYGVDLTGYPLDSLVQTQQLNLFYLLQAYRKMNRKELFFNDYFKLLAGTDQLKKQILTGLTEKEIRASWEPGLKAFQTIRQKYLIYPD